MLSRIGKKSQIGQTMTWTVATVIIVLILLLFIFAAGSEGVFKILGAGKEIDDSGSRVMDQQMLFAMLDYNYGKLRVMIEENKFDEAKVLAQTMLDEFETNGIICDFMVYEETARAGAFAKIDPKVRVIKGTANVLEPIMEINELKIRMECEKNVKK